MKKYAVLGNPIAHSKSPEIHQAFAQQFGIELSYERLLVPLEGLADALFNFYRQGGAGVNVTLPFKEEAFRLANSVSERSQRGKVVNTLTFADDGSLAGDNTDGIGLVRDLKLNHHIALQDQQIAIIGAGGAVRGIFAALLDEQPKKIVVVNRTLSRAEKLVTDFGHRPNVAICSWAEFADHPFDLIINATSAATKGENLELPEKNLKGAVCYDLAYGENAKEFLTWAHGASLSCDGVGMLVEQAAEAFYGWHGKRPDTHSIVTNMRATQNISPSAQIVQ